MILHDSPLAHVHCPNCGREMRPGTECMVCATAARLTTLGLSEPPGRGGIVSEGAIPRISLGMPAARAEVGPAVELPRPAPAPAKVAPAPKVATAEARPRPVPTPVRPSASARRWYDPRVIWKRYLPPVRLVWIFLLGIAWSQGAFLAVGQATPILAILFLGILTDLGFQWIRFPKLRVPDAALATSLFVALIIWPATFDLALASIAVVSVGLRHVVRISGHPALNPAAAGIVLATILFAMPTSWHVGLAPEVSVAIALMGALLVARAPHTYRLPLGYFAAYLPLTVLLTFALGGAKHWLSVLELGALGPASIFFGVFMVTEPRTAPSARPAMWVFAILVGAVSAGFPVLFTEIPILGAFGVIAPFLALFVGNVFTFALPSARGARRPVAAGSGLAAARVVTAAPTGSD